MCYSQHHLYLLQYTILKYLLDMCNLEQSEVIPPLSPKEKEGEGGKPGCVAAGIVTGRTAGYLLSSSSFVLFVCNHLQIDKNTLNLFGDHLDWGRWQIMIIIYNI